MSAPFLRSALVQPWVNSSLELLTNSLGLLSSLEDLLQGRGESGSPAQGTSRVRFQICCLETRDLFSGSRRTVRALLSAAAHLSLQSSPCHNKLSCLSLVRMQQQQRGEGSAQAGIRRWHRPCWSHSCLHAHTAERLTAGCLAEPSPLPDGIAQLLLCRAGHGDFARLGWSGTEQGHGADTAEAGEA